MNYILCHIRSGPNRSKADQDKLSLQIHEAWVSIIGDSRSDPGKECTIFVLSGIVSGIEKGFVIPAAGEDKAWLKEHLVEFRRLAEGGNSTFKDLFKELETREVFQDIL